MINLEPEYVQQLRARILKLESELYHLRASLRTAEMCIEYEQRKNTPTPPPLDVPDAPKVADCDAKGVTL